MTNLQAKHHSILGVIHQRGGMCACHGTLQGGAVAAARDFRLIDLVDGAGIAEEHQQGIASELGGAKYQRDAKEMQANNPP
jgi:hypothetical protein